MSKFLVGKTIKDIKIADDKMAILFKCLDGDHVVRVDADCCSHTWVETIEACVFPCVVADQEDIEMRDNLDHDGGLIQFYGHKITTDKGEIVIDYRNESNGYYGGNLVWPDNNYFYGGVFEQNESKLSWIDLETP